MTDSTVQKRKAVFLDRDGVIVEDVHYLHRPEDITLIDGAAETIAALNRARVPVVIVTNQSGIGRGYFTEAAYRETRAALAAMLAAHGAKVDAEYYCPDHPVEGLGAYKRESNRRKPGPGMVFEAAADLGLDLLSSVLVGDKRSDLEAGRAAGCMTALVRTGKGKTAEKEIADFPDSADAVFDTLADAREWIASVLYLQTETDIGCLD